jgi:hypothetical protein
MESFMGLKKKLDPQQVAIIASRGLFTPRGLSADEIRAVCAIALRNVPDHRQDAMVAARPRYEQVDMALAIARYCELGD